LLPFVFTKPDDNNRTDNENTEVLIYRGSVEGSMMGAREYLEKYIRSVPGGAIAWERSIFSHSGQWNAEDLVDAAVDIAWDTFAPEVALERTGLDFHRAGNYFVISPLSVTDEDFLGMVA